ncbi:hypothetical protein KKF84_19135 [Myxococcota bacterium]|nr:hypothetical protein [Myxococcota bacterium]
MDLNEGNYKDMFELGRDLIGLLDRTCPDGGAQLDVAVLEPRDKEKTPSRLRFEFLVVLDSEAAVDAFRADFKSVITPLFHTKHYGATISVEIHEPEASGSHRVEGVLHLSARSAPWDTVQLMDYLRTNLLPLGHSHKMTLTLGVEDIADDLQE